MIRFSVPLGIKHGSAEDKLMVYRSRVFLLCVFFRHNFNGVPSSDF